MRTIQFQSGATREVSEDLSYPVVGLDAEGRIVVDMGHWLFGLTLCCNAFDKGMEDGVYCRACYGAKPNADAGMYDPTVVDPVVPPPDPGLQMVADRHGKIWRWLGFGNNDKVEALFAQAYEPGSNEEVVDWVEAVPTGTEPTLENLRRAVMNHERKYDRRWLTLGEFRKATAHLPGDTPITIASPSNVPGSEWYNASLDESTLPKSWPDQEMQSIIIFAEDNFDTGEETCRFSGNWSGGGSETPPSTPTTCRRCWTSTTSRSQPQPRRSRSTSSAGSPAPTARPTRSGRTRW
jgi:hypothetical protein